MKLYSQAKKDKLSLGCSKILQEDYDKKLAEVLGEKNKRKNRLFGKNALRLKQYILKQQGKWFTFLKYEYVAPTNNRAERDIRTPVLKRKISQQNRSTEHMHSYEMQVSLYMTSKQQGIEYPKILNDILTPQITGKYWTVTFYRCQAPKIYSLTELFTNWLCFEKCYKSVTKQAIFVTEM